MDATLQLLSPRREGEGKTALVTGLAGFTGRYVADELHAAGYRVVGTSVPGHGAGDGLLPMDLTDRASVAAVVAHVQPDVVVHLAAIAFVAHADIGQFYSVNVMGTRNLLEALAALPKKPSAVLIASSANIYGNADLPMLDEQTPPAPANDYAVSKLAMEYMARLWMDKLPIIFTRPFNYTGVGQHENFLLPKIVAHFRRKSPTIELGNLHVWRDFSDVRMVAASYRALLDQAPAGQAFNISSRTAYSLGEALAMMNRIAGYEVDVRVNPAFVRANEVVRLVGDNTRLAGVVGAITPVPLEQTLRWMYEA